MSYSLDKRAKNLPGERWKTHPEFAHLHVSDLGRVRNLNTGRIIGSAAGSGSPRTAHPTRPHRYVQVGVAKGLRRAAHVLVLETWVGPRPAPDYEGDHRDYDGFNNRATNLQWITDEENRARRRYARA